jgi:hypothetical protein
MQQAHSSFDLDHGVGHPPAASGPRHRTAAPEAERRRGRQREAERSQRAKRGPWLSPLGFGMVRSDGRIHALGRFHIGGVAYCVWALPPIDFTVMWSTPQWPTRWSKPNSSSVVLKNLGLMRLSCTGLVSVTNEIEINYKASLTNPSQESTSHFFKVSE